MTTNRDSVKSWILENFKFAQIIEESVSDELSEENKLKELVKSFDSEYPKINGNIDGLEIRLPVPNTSSIEASLNLYQILPGIRSISLDGWIPNLDSWFYNIKDVNSANELTKSISQNNFIHPMIIVLEKDKEPWLLEGDHRLWALKKLGMTRFPAMVVVDLECFGF